MKIIIGILFIIYMIRMTYYAHRFVKSLNEFMILISFERFKNRIIENRKHVEECNCKNCSISKNFLPPIPHDHEINKWRKRELEQQSMELGLSGSVTVELFCLVAIFSFVLLHT